MLGEGLVWLGGAGMVSAASQGTCRGTCVALTLRLRFQQELVVEPRLVLQGLQMGRRQGPSLCSHFWVLHHPQISQV